MSARGVDTIPFFLFWLCLLCRSQLSKKCGRGGENASLREVSTVQSRQLSTGLAERHK